MITKLEFEWGSRSSILWVDHSDDRIFTLLREEWSYKGFENTDRYWPKHRSFSEDELKDILTVKENSSEGRIRNAFFNLQRRELFLIEASSILDKVVDKSSWRYIEEIEKLDIQAIHYNIVTDWRGVSTTLNELYKKKFNVDIQNLVYGLADSFDMEQCKELFTVIKSIDQRETIFDFSNEQKKLIKDIQRFDY